MTDRDSLLVGLAVVAGVVLVGPLLMWAGMVGVGMMGGGMWGGAWGPGAAAPGWLWLVGMLVPLGLLAAVVALGVVAIRALAGGSTGTDPAIEALREAYARGDLSDDEYERRLQRLRERDTGSGN